MHAHWRLESGESDSVTLFTEGKGPHTCEQGKGINAGWAVEKAPATEMN